jgi:decaprenyl-phosphate phosphoribosyltransferase
MPPAPSRLNAYLDIARPSHWFKNVFVLPGILIAVLGLGYLPADLGLNLALGLAALCLIMSANYSINEYLDAEFDRHHPLKQDRPAVHGLISGRGVVIQYLVLATAGLLLAYPISVHFFVTAAAFLLMGGLYNVRPARLKDLPYLDALSESLNNPLRLLLGWFMVTSLFWPPSSLLIAYWMGGAFLMAVKRYAELRRIADPDRAGLYRRSFRFYTEDRLLVSILFYAMSFAFFFGVFMIKHRIELLLSMPLFALLFAWYLKLGMAPDSAAQRPEQLYRQPLLLGYAVVLAAVVFGLFLINEPRLQWFLHDSFL